VPGINIESSESKSDAEGSAGEITFIDTPGHEAF
jgi:translation initiation factor IF-2